MTFLQRRDTEVGMMTHLPVSCIPAGFFLFIEFSPSLLSIKVSDVQLDDARAPAGDWRSFAVTSTMRVVSYDTGALTGSYSVLYTNKIIKQTRRKEAKDESM